MLFYRPSRRVVFTILVATSRFLPSQCMTRLTPYQYELPLQQDLKLDEKDMVHHYRYLHHHSSGSKQDLLNHPNYYLRHQYYDQRQSQEQNQVVSKSKSYSLIKGKKEEEKEKEPFVSGHFGLGWVKSKFLFYDTTGNNAKNFIMDDTTHPQGRLDRNSKKRRKLSNKEDDTDDDTHKEGWIPSVFPDPLQNPEMCNVLNSFIRYDGNNKNKSSTILMCDPDEALNDDDREFIGRSLIDFSLSHDQDVSGCGAENNYNVGVAGDWKTYKMTGTAFADMTEGRQSKLSSLGGSFIFRHKERKVDIGNIRVEVGVAITKKIDVNGILNKFQFFSFEDVDSMTDDAAQFFASIVHNQWFNDKNIVKELPASEDCEKQDRGVNGILIFLSIEDRVCFISSGDSITSVLPWWRLEKVVGSMKEDLKRKNYSFAIVNSIQEISDMLNNPPTVKEKLKDFFARFGLVFLFSICTFALAVYGEIRDRQRRFEYAEINTQLTEVEEEKARMLQQSYKTSCCAICLEEFITQDSVENDGILTREGKPIKLLRCGHIYHLLCWRTWIQSGTGDISSCPVCRRDISKGEEPTLDDNEIMGEEQSLLIPSREANHDETYGTTTTFQGVNSMRDPNVEIPMM